MINHTLVALCNVELSAAMMQLFVTLCVGLQLVVASSQPVHHGGLRRQLALHGQRHYVFDVGYCCCCCWDCSAVCLQAPCDNQ